jgi:16S rRNA (uracil1498-N3)-methyltransferase
VSTSDGAGGWRRCRLGADGELLPEGAVLRPERPLPAVTVAFAVPKGDRAEWAVQKLTEVGVDRIVPLVTDRGVVRWPADRAARQVERWRAIARHAAMQSRRLTLPDVGEPQPPAALVGPAVALTDPDGEPPRLSLPTLLIGPEGGWSDGELGLGLARVTLGPGVLRTETAAVIAGGLLAAIRMGLVRP